MAIDEDGEKPPRRKILALLNPFGGRGRAPAKWEIALEILNLAHLDVTLRPTERAMHAYDIVKDELMIGDYDVIVTISGDGLIHEAVNGALNRNNKELFMEHTTFGFIPAGTANGLITSILK